MMNFASVFFYLWLASTNAYPLDKSRNCPDEFVQLNNSCYYFSNTSIVRSWTNAEKICVSRNSHLVSIETLDELLAIDRYYIASDNRDVWYWTSGSDLENKKEFNWMEMQKPVSHKWCKDHPIDAKKNPCILLGLAIQDYEQCWINRDCARKYSFICESKLEIKSVSKSESKTVNIYVDKWFNLNEIF